MKEEHTEVIKSARVKNLGAEYRLRVGWGVSQPPRNFAEIIAVNVVTYS